MTVWVYVDTSKQVGDKDHLKVFASNDSAEAWLEKNDPEGVAFEYELQNESDLASVPELTSTRTHASLVATDSDRTILIAPSVDDARNIADQAPHQRRKTR